MKTINYDRAIYVEEVDSVSGLDLVIEDYDLYEDYENPKTYKAINLRTGRKCKVVIDHNRTATGTTGTGDTIVKVIA